MHYRHIYYSKVGLYFGHTVDKLVVQYTILIDQSCNIRIFIIDIPMRVFVRIENMILYFLRLGWAGHRKSTNRTEYAISKSFPGDIEQFLDSILHHLVAFYQ